MTQKGGKVTLLNFTRDYMTIRAHNVSLRRALFNVISAYRIIIKKNNKSEKDMYTLRARQCKAFTKLAIL